MVENIIFTLIKVFFYAKSNKLAESWDKNCSIITKILNYPFNIKYL